ncbi:MAG: hypothetical protein J6B52_03095 [Clostridia bacterium]|nr:hypothetical protein [Clostridia bacterium]
MKQAKQVILTVVATFAAFCAVSLLCIVGVTVPGTSSLVFIAAATVYSVLLTVTSATLASKKSKNVLLAFLITTVAVFTLIPIMFFIFDGINIPYISSAVSYLAMTLGYPSLMLLMAGSENSGMGGIPLFIIVALIPVLPILTALITKKRVKEKLHEKRT